jgi:hypothetical protein
VKAAERRLQAEEAAAAAARLLAEEEVRAAAERARVKAAAAAEASAVLLDFDDVDSESLTPAPTTFKQAACGCKVACADGKCPLTHPAARGRHSGRVAESRPSAPVAAWSFDDDSAVSPSSSLRGAEGNEDAAVAKGASKSTTAAHLGAPASAWGGAAVVVAASAPATKLTPAADIFLEDVFDASGDDVDTSAAASPAARAPPVQAPRPPAGIASPTATLNFFDSPVVRDVVSFSSTRAAGGGIPSALSSAERARISSALVGDGAPNAGAGGGLPPSWLSQPLCFSARDGLRYGLVQPRGGPCGPLAAVNAEAIKRLLFGRAPLAAAPPADAAALLAAATEEWTPATDTPRVPAGGAAPEIPLDAPIEALFCAVLGAAVDILWRARAPGAATAKLVVPSSAAQGAGGCALDKTAVLEVASRHALALALCARAASFFGENAGGLGLLVFSALLTRGLDGIADDADAPTPPLLHARYGYAAQELVHLFIL